MPVCKSCERCKQSFSNKISFFCVTSQIGWSSVPLLRWCHMTSHVVLLRWCHMTSHVVLCGCAHVRTQARQFSCSRNSARATSWPETASLDFVRQPRTNALTHLSLSAAAQCFSCCCSTHYVKPSSLTRAWIVTVSARSDYCIQ
jgi:hypothetical protein